MSTATLDRTYEPEDLLRMRDGRFELVDGELRERPMGARADQIGTRLSTAVSVHVKPQLGGVVFGPKCGYQAFPDKPKQVRFPDVSYVEKGRFPGDEVPDGHVRIAPNLAVEVVSLNDESAEVEERVADFLNAGTALVWLIYPETQSAYVVRADGTAARLTSDKELDGENVLPGFRYKLADLFLP